MVDILMVKNIQVSGLHTGTCTHVVTRICSPIKPSQNPPPATSCSLSLCRGITCISEDSSEIMFLLVENYT